MSMGGSGKRLSAVQARSCMAIPRLPRFAKLSWVQPLVNVSDTVPGECARIHRLQRSPSAMQPSVLSAAQRAQWREAFKIVSACASASCSSAELLAGPVRWRLCQVGPVSIPAPMSQHVWGIHANTSMYRHIQMIYIHIHTFMNLVYILCIYECFCAYYVCMCLYFKLPVSSRAFPMRWHAETLSCEFMMLFPNVAGLRLVRLPFTLTTL